MEKVVEMLLFMLLELLELLFIGPLSVKSSSTSLIFLLL